MIAMQSERDRKRVAKKAARKLRNGRLDWPISAVASWWPADGVKGEWKFWYVYPDQRWPVKS